MINSQALRVELEVGKIISEQARHGVNFDSERAKFYIHVLTDKIIQLDKLAVPQLPRMVVQGNVFLKPFKKNGQLNQHVEKYVQESGITGISGPFSRIDFTPFDMSKTALIKEYLMGAGWEPDTWNWKDADHSKLEEYLEDLLESKSLEQRLTALNFSGQRTKGNLRECLKRERKWPTSPKITESTFDSVQGTVPSLVKDRVVFSHRRSLLQGLVEKVRADGKLSAQANSLATPTGRMRHRIVVNIPAPKKAIFGKECRSLFMGDYDSSIPALILRYKDQPIYVPAGRQLIVGYDGSGLELRMLAHYINDPEYTSAVLSGDPHADNLLLLKNHWKKVNPAIRDDAKTFLYAFIYGAGDKKLGSIVGGGLKEGAKLREEFLKRNPRLASIVAKVQEDSKRGYLIGIDGRRLILRRGENGKIMTHKALNLLLQGAGAIVMKYAMVILDEKAKELNLNAHKVLDVHDEGQWTCHPKDAVQLAELMSNCVREAGEFLKMNIRLDSDAKMGRTWYHTH